MKTSDGILLIAFLPFFHFPVQYHFGVLSIYHKRTGISTTYDCYFHIGRESHCRQAALQTLSQNSPETGVRAA